MPPAALSRLSPTPMTAAHHPATAPPPPPRHQEWRCPTRPRTPPVEQPPSGREGSRARGGHAQPQGTEAAKCSTSPQSGRGIARPTDQMPGRPPAANGPRGAQRRHPPVEKCRQRRRRAAPHRRRAGGAASEGGGAASEGGAAASEKEDGQRRHRPRGHCWRWGRRRAGAGDHDGGHPTVGTALRACADERVRLIRRGPSRRAVSHVARGPRWAHARPASRHGPAQRGVKRGGQLPAASAADAGHQHPPIPYCPVFRHLPLP